MIRKTIFAMLLIGVMAVTAQEQKRISGKVIDQETGDPLSFSHVGIFNSSYGTVANLDGDFSLIIPSEYNQADLSASYLGYELKSIPVNSLQDGMKVVIKLKSTVTELPELVIRNKEKSIMEEAIEAIPKNHDQDAMKLRAFWRASIKSTSNTYVQLTEYAFDMFRHGIVGEEENAMKILHGRVARDTAFFSELAGMHIGVTPSTLFVNSLLKEHPLLDKKIVRKHEYKVIDASSYNGRAVFVVGFKPKTKAKGNLYQGEILLDTETLAFVKISFEKLISPDDPDKVFGGFSTASLVAGLGNSTMDTYANELNYQFVNGRWYLSHAKYDIDWTMRRKKGGVVHPVNFKADFVVTDIKKKDIHVPPEEELASKSILQRQTTANSDNFWEEYNYLKADNNFDELFEEILARK